MSAMKPDVPLESMDQIGSTPGSATRERHSLTLDQRRALRRWANSQPVRPSHKACIDWFASQYQQTISQSTVSHSLSPKYARLDGDPQLSGSRLRFGNWPDVEKLVLLWHQQMLANGRQPSNEELADKAKTIYHQLPRYKDEPAPEFSPGWIHRFKKRYGLLVRRQRRPTSSEGGNPAPGTTTLQNLGDDIPYLAENLPRYLNVNADLPPVTVMEYLQRFLGVMTTLEVCERVKEEVLRRQHNPSPDGGPGTPNNNPMGGNAENTGIFHSEEDPEVVLQNALRVYQQQEENNVSGAANLAGVTPDHQQPQSGGDRTVDNGLPALGAIANQAYAQHAMNAAGLTTPNPGTRNASVGPRAQPQQAPPAQPQFAPNTPQQVQSQQVQPQQVQPQQVQPQQQTPQQPQTANGGGNAGGGAQQGEELTLTPIPSGAPVSVVENPVRCPFCLNKRMLRTIKEAVEHMSSHVVV
ncbi:hypothetical protein QC763_600560 [Podospora pseudopauciseta]|uniref:HTH CENPB-type domain-containing protein n=1 Tax=Podospora pseudopauciseta TaxID=2093780 RepID=A0ABR0H5C3_9PEZI|nr:hypothetical protein QC763_600560 [Podospora pseudopauciseta]